MNEDAKCAELCEGHGFSRAAKLLRAVAEERSQVFIVRASGPQHWGDLENLGHGPEWQDKTGPDFPLRPASGNTSWRLRDDPARSWDYTVESGTLSIPATFFLDRRAADRHVTRQTARILNWAYFHQLECDQALSKLPPPPPPLPWCLPNGWERLSSRYPRDIDESSKAALEADSRADWQRRRPLEAGLGVIPVITGLARDQFPPRVAEILGTQWSRRGRKRLLGVEDSAFFDGVTDEQLSALARLVTIRLFEVEGLSLARISLQPRARLSHESLPENVKVDEFRACSEVCEQHEFFRQAKLLRALAEKGRKMYAIAAPVVVPVSQGDDVVDLVADREGLFVDRSEAQHRATPAQWLRGRNVAELVRFTRLRAGELDRRLSAIFGTKFMLVRQRSRPAWECDDPDWWGTIPASATDDQIAEVLKLFNHQQQLVEVREVEFGG